MLALLTPISNAAPTGPDLSFSPEFDQIAELRRFDDPTLDYRVLDPKSNDNSICWMTEAEFRQLKDKAQWRDRFAVWRNWNANGEVVTYTVPPGKGLPVWRGTTASQPFKDGNGNIVKANDKGDAFWLEGGAEQLVVNPADLQKIHLGKREPTNWGYGEGDIDVSLVGVPVLKTNWRE